MSEAQSPGHLSVKFSDKRASEFLILLSWAAVRIHGNTAAASKYSANAAAMTAPKPK
jgi:hypothetical protein